MGSCNHYESSNLALSPDELSKAEFCSLNERSVLNLINDQKLLIMISWITLIVIDYSHMFSEVLMVDTVADKNNEDHPILTIGGLTHKWKIISHYSCIPSKSILSGILMDI